MDLSTAEFFGLALGTGFFAGLANFGATLLTDFLGGRRETKAQRTELAHQTEIQSRELTHQGEAQGRDIAHQRDLQSEERAHQAAIRAETAFFAARDKLLKNAVDARAWAMWSWGKDFGGEVDYYPISLKPPALTSAAEVMAALEEIAGMHPSKRIRVYARSLTDSIDGVVNMPDGDGTADPGVRNYSDWSYRAGELIDAMHDPTYDPGKNLADEAATVQ